MIVEYAGLPVYLRIATKAKHLRQLGMSDKAIARQLRVSDKTVAKAVASARSITFDGRQPAMPCAAYGRATPISVG
jgi:transposase